MVNETDESTLKNSEIRRSFSNTSKTIWYRKWNNIDITCHIAVDSDTEAMKKLINNNFVVLFFVEEGASLVTEFINRLSSTHIIFGVVQPYGSKYRVAFFTRQGFIPFGPEVPSRTLSEEQLGDYLFSKLYNGIVASQYSEPYSRYFYHPRSTDLEGLIQKYQKLRSKPYNPRISKKKKKAVTDKF